MGSPRTRPGGGKVPRAPLGHAGGDSKRSAWPAPTYSGKRPGPFICYTPRSCRGWYQADRQPGELHLHLHEIAAEDVAAVMRRQRED